ALRMRPPPVLGVGLMRNAWMTQNPDAPAKVVAAMRKAYAFGQADKPGVAKILTAAANLSDADAAAYAGLWDGIYTVSLERENEAELNVSGCMLKILCGSQTWTRVPDVNQQAANKN
ncbi:hypothetical protein, partial [Citrobacter sp. VF227]